MKITELTNAQLIKLCKLRIKNEPEVSSVKIEVSSVKIESKLPTSISFIIAAKEWSPFRKVVQLEKFYPNEFFYLIKCGVKF